MLRLGVLPFGEVCAPSWVVVGTGVVPVPVGEPVVGVGSVEPPPPAPPPAPPPPPPVPGTVGVGTLGVPGTVGVGTLGVPGPGTLTVGIWIWETGVPGGTSTWTGTVVPSGSVTLTVLSSADAGDNPRPVTTAATSVAASTI